MAKTWRKYETLILIDAGLGMDATEEMGLTKLVCDADSGKVLGVHILGPHAEDLIAAGAIALRGGLTLRQLNEIHAVFPSVGSMILDAAAGW